MVIGAALLSLLLAVGIGVAAYDAGVSHGLARSGQAVQVVREVHPGWGYGFPFGILLFPLLVIGIVLGLRFLFWRGRWGGPGWGPRGYGLRGPGWPGPWGQLDPEAHAEWHRRHDQQVEEPPGSAGGPAGA
jgi:hypothetical protein